MNQITDALYQSVKRHTTTPIKTWDGTAFQPSNILVNIKSAAHMKRVEHTHILGTLPNDPLAGIQTIQDPAGQVWNILEYDANTYGDRAYGSTYYIRKATGKYKYYSLKEEIDSPVSGSGFSYEATLPPPKHVWTSVVHDRYYNAQRITSREAVYQIMSAFLPKDLPLSKGDTLVSEEGFEFTLDTFDSSYSRSHLCFVTQVGAKNAT